MNLPSINQIIQLTIHNIGHHGEGIGSYHGYTIFVEGALPGETVDVRLTQRQKRYGRGELITISKPSPDRVKPPCPFYGECGGCQLMHLSYPQQLITKQQRVKDAFQRIAKIQDVNILPCISSPLTLGYRNKIQLPVKNSENKGLLIGLYARSSHDLVPIDHCLIHCPIGEEVFKEVNALLKQSTISAYDPIAGTGELRHILIKSAVNAHEALVIFVTNGRASSELQQVAKQIMMHCLNVKGVVQNINTERSNVILGDTYQVLEGQSSIQERLGDLLFKISAASFFQVNPQQAEQLYAKALEFAALTGTETVLDAFCGVGTLSLFFARHAKRVIGVECVPEAIKDANENAVINEISNVSFVCAPAETYIGSLSDRVDVMILNPPRKGCAENLLDSIGILLPNTIVYISCDPATLARDISILSPFGYSVDMVQPFDMFPQTAHVECVVKLSKIK